MTFKVLAYAQPDVLLQAVLVQPRLGTMKVADIQEAKYRLVFRPAVTSHYKNIMFRRHSYCYRIGQSCGGYRPCAS